jgi:hypothetical protein
VGTREFVFLGITLGEARDHAYAFQYGELLGQGALFGISAGKNLRGAKKIPTARRAMGASGNLAKGIILARGARAKPTVMKAKAIVVGISGNPAVSTVGEGERRTNCRAGQTRKKLISRTSTILIDNYYIEETVRRQKGGILLRNRFVIGTLAVGEVAGVAQLAFFVAFDAMNGFTVSATAGLLLF